MICITYGAHLQKELSIALGLDVLRGTCSYLGSVGRGSIMSNKGQTEAQEGLEGTTRMRWRYKAIATYVLELSLALPRMRRIRRAITAKVPELSRALSSMRQRHRVTWTWVPMPLSTL
ncbi:hypothetical protein B296_00050526 [Ensete ventricosum]|uniref:Uncharacterized protein n=1 Tax=Ensete ventricosum TaxID=4639 RepID=A0A426YL07_ENSVE|nr:hypothetical protein B296_00050526 [Ensete ventricosum]